MFNLIEAISYRFEDVNFAEKRNAIVSVISGLLFFAGWWLIIDIAANYPDQNDFKHAYYCCGVFASLALILINSVSNSQIRGDSFADTTLISSSIAKVWFFFGFLISFASIIASLWIYFEVYVVPNKNPHWPGVALFLQNLFIFISSLVFKFGRTDDNL